MAYDAIILEVAEKVATITLNRPDKMNAMDEQLRDDLIDAIDKVAQDDTVGAVIITGAGRAFCAGGDLSLPIFNMTGQPGKIKQSLQEANRIPLSLRNMSKPVIAAVNGAAVGFGHSLALACDIIISSEEAKYGQVWTTVGYHPDTGSSYFLPRLIGTAKACELIFTGKVVDAREAEKIGMVNMVVPAESLMETAGKLANKLAHGPSVAIGLAKSSIYNGLNMTMEQALNYELEAAILTLHTEDQKEGINAFKEKRKPEFKGK